MRKQYCLKQTHLKTTKMQNLKSDFNCQNGSVSSDVKRAADQKCADADASWDDSQHLCTDTYATLHLVANARTYASKVTNCMMHTQWTFKCLFSFSIFK